MRKSLRALRSSQHHLSSVASTILMPMEVVNTRALETHTLESIAKMMATEISMKMPMVIGESLLQHKVTPVVLNSGQQLVEVAHDAAFKSDS